ARANLPTACSRRWRARAAGGGAPMIGGGEASRGGRAPSWVPPVSSSSGSRRGGIRRATTSRTRKREKTSTTSPRAAPGKRATHGGSARRSGRRSGRWDVSIEGASDSGAALLEPGERKKSLAAFLDQASAALQIAVAHRAVEIDGRLLDALEEIEVERAIVDGVAHLHGEGVGEERDVVVERVHGAVRTVADAIAHGEGRQEGQHEVRPGPYAPDSQRLAEVGTLPLQPHLLPCDVEQPTDAEGGVDDEAPHLLGRVEQFQLQHLVHEPRGHPQVGAGVVDPGLEHVRHDEVVALRYRLPP